MAITIKRIQIQSCINHIEFTDIYIYLYNRYRRVQRFITNLYRCVCVYEYILITYVKLSKTCVHNNTVTVCKVYIFGHKYYDIQLFHYQ